MANLEPVMGIEYPSMAVGVSVAVAIALGLVLGLLVPYVMRRDPAGQSGSRSSLSGWDR